MATPQTIHCPSIDCPGSDNPIANLSSERPDPAGELTYLGIGYAPDPNDPNGPPGDPGPNSWTAKGCIADCTSLVSQDDADLCAARQVYLCQNNPDTPPTPTPTPGPRPGVFFSHEQTCTSKCPDGLPFSFTVPQGTFVRSSQLLADRSAHSYACRQARLHRICLSALDPAQGVIGSGYTGSITATGAFLDPRINLWEITSGSLPDGLALTSHFQGPVATIDGTPTVSGVFNFSIRVTAPNGDFMEKGQTLTVTATAPTLQAYWTLSESGVLNPRLDSVTALALTPNAQTALTSEPGKFGNGLGFLERGTFSNFITAVVSQLGNTGPGFSIFFWFKVDNWANAADYGVAPFVDMASLGSSGFFVRFVPDGLGGQLVIQVNDDNHNPFAPAPFRPTTGVWYLVHAFFDPVLGQVGYSINNGLNVYDPTVGATFNLFGTGRLQIGQTWSSSDSTTNALTIDELGVKLDRNLTAGEVAYLYNAGLGRTWPL